jgi:hypothetical protein
LYEERFNNNNRLENSATRLKENNIQNKQHLEDEHMTDGDANTSSDAGTSDTEFPEPGE